MNRNHLIIPLVLILLITAPTAQGITGIKLVPAGGTGWAAGDQIEEADPGYNFGAALQAELWKGFDYGLRYFHSRLDATVPNHFNPDTTVTSYQVTFIHDAFCLTNTWSPGWEWVDPYIRGSLGLYSWQELHEDTILTAMVINSQTEDTTYNDLKATSFGIGFGGGLRIWPTEFLGVRLGVDYDLVFSENREKFGSQDANDNMLRVGAEIIFRLPMGE